MGDLLPRCSRGTLSHRVLNFAKISGVMPLLACNRTNPDEELAEELKPAPSQFTELVTDAGMVKAAQQQREIHRMLEQRTDQVLASSSALRSAVAMPRWNQRSDGSVQACWPERTALLERLGGIEQQRMCRTWQLEVDLRAVDSLNECFDVDIVETKEWYDPRCTEWPTHPFILSVAQYPLQLAAATIAGMTPDCSLPEPECVHQRNLDQPLGTLHQYHSYSARIGSAMSLHNFPFDSHILQVAVRYPQLFQGRRDPACGTWLLPVSTCVGVSDRLQEWTMYGTRLQQKLTPGTKVGQVVQVLAVRRPMYYLSTAVLPAFIVSMLSFVVLEVEVTALADRCSVTLTALLTAAAMKFTVADSLPKLAYFTIIDWLLLICFMVPATITVESAIAAAYADSLQDPTSFDDDVYLWTIFGVSVAAVLIVVGCAVSDRRNMHSKFSSMHSENVDSLREQNDVAPTCVEPVFLIERKL